MANRYEILLGEEKKRIALGGCPKGGRHKWGIDGAHSNEYCKKCFVDKPEPVKLEDKYITDDNRTISLFEEEK